LATQQEILDAYTEHKSVRAAAAQCRVSHAYVWKVVRRLAPELMQPPGGDPGARERKRRQENAHKKD
jgi:hypothetical protein